MLNAVGMFPDLQTVYTTEIYHRLPLEIIYLHCMCLNLKAKEVYNITESADTLFHTKLFLLLLGIAVCLSISSYICHFVL